MATIPCKTSSCSDRACREGAGTPPHRRLPGSVLIVLAQVDGYVGVAAGGNLWFASEWIAQRCTFTQYLADTTCGGTRGALGNWSTHLSRLSS
jgi:hypothetical protein